MPDRANKTAARRQHGFAAVAMAFALLPAAQALAQPHAADEAAIRQLRVGYNAVIAARQPDRFAAFVAAGIVEMSSQGEVTRGAQPLAESYASQEFKDPSFIAYDRRTDTVQVSADGTLAVERGHWRARRRAAGGGETGGGGLYQAGWIKQGGAWRIQTEAYASLACGTSAKCP